MKKPLVIVLFLISWGAFLFAQAETTAPQQTPRTTTGFKAVDSYKEEKEIIIEAKSLVPATGTFQDKTDTYQKSGDYRFTFDLDSLRETSNILLNKWLKESK